MNDTRDINDKIELRTSLISGMAHPSRLPAVRAAGQNQAKHAFLSPPRPEMFMDENPALQRGDLHALLENSDWVHADADSDADADYDAEDDDDDDDDDEDGSNAEAQRRAAIRQAAAEMQAAKRQQQQRMQADRLALQQRIAVLTTQEEALRAKGASADQIAAATAIEGQSAADDTQLAQLARCVSAMRSCRCFCRLVEIRAPSDAQHASLRTDLTFSACHNCSLLTILWPIRPPGAFLREIY